MLKINIDTKSAQAAVDRLERDLKTLGRSTEKTDKEFKQLEARLRRKLGADQAKRSIDSMTKSMHLSQLAVIKYKLSVGDLGGAFRSFGGVLGKVRSSLFGLKTMMAGLGLAVVFGDIIRVGAKFEKTMAGVKGVANATAKEFIALNNIAKKMGETTEFTASQAAEGLKFLAMAGFGVEKSIAALPGVLDLATAGQLDLGEAADIASNALTAMRLDVEQLGMVNDVFVKTITTSNTDIRMLAESFKYSAPLAAGLGYNIVELSSWIGLLGNAGIQGSMAGTQLNAVFGRLPKLFAKYGESAKDATGKTKGVTDAIELLARKGATAEEVLKDFQMRGGRAMLAFMGMGTKAMREYEKIIADSEGANKKLADTMRSTTIGAFKELMSALEGVKISAFEEQTGELNEIIKELTQAVRTNKDEIVSFINTLASSIYGLTKSLMDVMGPFTTFIGLLGKSVAYSAEISKVVLPILRLKDAYKEYIDMLKVSVQEREKAIAGTVEQANIEIYMIGLLEEEKKAIEELAKANKKRDLEYLINRQFQEGMVKITAVEMVADIRTESSSQELDRLIEEMEEYKKGLREWGKENAAAEAKIAEGDKKAVDEGLKYAQKAEKDSWLVKLEMSKDFTEQRLKIEKDRYEELVKSSEEIYNNFLSSIQSNFSDTFYDLFSGQLDSFKDFTDRMKETFLRTLAEMAAKAAMTKLAPALSSMMGMGTAGTTGASGGQDMSWLGTLGGYGMAAYAGFTFGQMVGSWMGLGKKKDAYYRMKPGPSGEWRMLGQFQEDKGYTAPTGLTRFGSSEAGAITDIIEDMYQSYVDQANILLRSLPTGVKGPGDISFKSHVSKFKMEDAEYELKKLAELWTDTLWDAFEPMLEKMGFMSMEAVVKGIAQERDALGNAFQDALQTGSWLLFKSSIAEQIYSTISQDLTQALIESAAIQGALMPVYGQIEKAMASATEGGGFDIGLFRGGVSGIGSLLSTSFSELRPAFEEIADLGRMLRELFVGSFQHGGIVPQTGLAMVHEGESITPGGGSLNLTIQANVITTNNVRGWMRDALEDLENYREGRPLQRFDLQTAGINVS